MEKICAKAIEDTGGPAKLAALLNERAVKPITPQAISQWKRVPSDRVLDVEAITGKSRYDLRPDIFGAAPKTGAAA